MSRRKPLKRFSQVFLADKNIAREIVSSLEISSDDIILEIGTGRGTLTEIIADTGARVYTFEFDRQLIDDLERKFNDVDNVVIINQDFLKINPSDYYRGSFKLIGNIPYDITSPLIDWMMRFRGSINRAIITTQRELAERISSNPGNKNWAPISIFCQTAFEISSVLTIPPKAFYPPPKIFSTTLLFEPKNGYNIKDWDFFTKVVRQSFNQRRKLLINNLADQFGIDKSDFEKILLELGFNNNIRAEQVGIEEFIKLAEKIKKGKHFLIGN